VNRITPIFSSTSSISSIIVGGTFLVSRGGLRVPADGPLTIEEVHGEYYIVGQSSWERCESREHAVRRLDERIRTLDPSRLAQEALEDLESGQPGEYSSSDDEAHLDPLAREMFEIAAPDSRKGRHRAH
jgi:hypothetical protein